jgi:sec-independent protein translocase protein TatB
MGIGFLELVVIGIAALVLLGPERLPEVMRTLAKFYVQLRRTSNDFKGAFDHVVREAESEMRTEELAKLRQLVASQVAPVDPIKEPSPDQAPVNAPVGSPSPRAEHPPGWDSSSSSPHPDPSSKKPE